MLSLGNGYRLWRGVLQLSGRSGLWGGMWKADRFRLGHGAWSLGNGAGLGAWGQLFGGGVEDAIDEQEQEAATGNPVIPLCPTGRAIGSTEQTVDEPHDVHREAQVMQDPPGLLADQFPDVETHIDDQPDIEPDLSDPNPGGAIPHGRKRHKDLCDREIDVMIAQQ